MKIFKNILNTIINILIVLVLVISVLVATISLTSKKSGVSSVFGYSVQVIVSDSMKGGNPEYEGGDFQENDVLITRVVKNPENEKYEVGDIITYVGELQGNISIGEQLICHRIVDVKNVDGRTVYQTWGDNRKISIVPDQMEESEYIGSDSIVTKYKTKDYNGIRIKGVGKVFRFLHTQMGFFLCVLLPMIIFFLYILIKVVIDAVNFKIAKADEERKENGDSKPANMTDEEFEQFKEFMAQKNAEKAEPQDSEKTISADETDTSAGEAEE